MTSPLPTRRCRVIDPDAAMDEIRAFLSGLEAEGERPWCEVWYPAPEHLSAADWSDWEARQGETYDAVELLDGEIVTLPSYAELTGGA
ncbi:hypothetical protein [Microbacterium sp. 3J1]|uniref:hypothetical protein n=1 Tax=Microbacterium sp. 3J1 TaxID=861269 RepID=UPI000AE2120A|nr:hypothetical protein [Microbacterium sp. 3J1]